MAITFAILATGLTFILIEADAFERFYEYTRDHEDWELDEIAMGVTAVVVAFSIVVSIAAVVVLSRYLAQVKSSMELEAQLAHSRKLQAVGTLVGGLAHSINNYLVPIRTLSKMAREAVAPDSVTRQDLDKVMEAADGATQVMNEVLVFARASETEPNTCNIASAFQTAMGLAKVSVPQSVYLTHASDPIDQSIAMSQSDFQTVVLSLISNSVAAIGQEPGDISVGLTAMQLTESATLSASTIGSGTYAVLKITDSGLGMDDDTRERIFEPFFTTKGVGEGTGLGMSVVFGMVSDRGGGIDVESALGAGTKITVYLPLGETQSSNVID